MMRVKSIEVDIRLISDKLKRATLRGVAYLDSGFLAGEIDDPQHTFTHGELVLVTAFTFTGCPVAARTTEPQLNPWHETGGEYVGQRSLRLNACVATSRISSEVADSSIMMDLEIDLSGAFPKVVSIEQPFQERICQRGKGIFEGEFDLLFGEASGKRIMAHAESEYRLKVANDYPPVWRNITIVNSQNKHRFTQVEQIDMFVDGAAADADLDEKCRVFSLQPRPASVVVA